MATGTSRTHRTPKNWRARFLDELTQYGNVRASCEAAGVGKSMVYELRERDAAFATEWQTALDDAIERLELVAHQRAEEMSDTLMIFLLKAHRPDKYRETIRQQQEHSGSVRVEFVNDWRRAGATGDGEGSTE